MGAPEGRSTSATPNRQGMYPSEPFPHFVDDYLAYSPGSAPDSRQSRRRSPARRSAGRPGPGRLDTHVRALAGFGRRLEPDRPGAPRPSERWTTRSSRPTSRGGSTTSRRPGVGPEPPALRGAARHQPGVPGALRLRARSRARPADGVEAAPGAPPRAVGTDNIKEAPGIFVKTGLETWRGVLSFIEKDLPKAFSRLDDLHILGDLADTSTDAAAAVSQYIAVPRDRSRTGAKASFRLGRERFERKLKLEEGIAQRGRAARHRPARAERGAGRLPDRRGKLNGAATDGNVARRQGAASRSRHAGGRGAAAAGRAAEVPAAAGRGDVARVEPVVVAPSPEFYRWAFASMWTPGPFETKASRAYYYLTDALPSWPADRQHEHLRDFNAPTLWNISIHEVYPGHYVHFQYLRNVASKVRKSTFFAPMSFVEGWAHYCEQMMVEAGFRKSDHAFKLGQLAEAPGAAGARGGGHPSALRGHVGGAGDAVLPGRGLPRGIDGAARGRARHVRSRATWCTRSAS